MRKLLCAAAVAGLALVLPARASDVPLNEVEDQVLAAELVALMLEAQLDRLRGALTDPDVHMIVIGNEPMLIDAQRVDDLVFVGQLAMEWDPKVKDAVRGALQRELGKLAEGIDFMPDDAISMLAVQALKQKLAEAEEKQAAILKKELLGRASTLAELKFAIEIWWKEIYPNYINMEVEFRDYKECKWQVELTRTGEYGDFDATLWRMYDSVWTWVPSTHHCGAPDIPYDQPYRPAQEVYTFPMAANFQWNMYDLRRIEGNLDLGADCKYYGHPSDARTIDGDWGCESGFKTHGHRIHLGKVRIMLQR